MHVAFNVILWTSANFRTERVIFVRHKRPQIYASGMTISGERTEQYVVMGFGELAAVD